VTSLGSPRRAGPEHEKSVYAIPHAELKVLNVRFVTEHGRSKIGIPSSCVEDISRKGHLND
jgi:hypothetical protein